MGVVPNFEHSQSENALAYGPGGGGVLGSVLGITASPHILLQAQLSVDYRVVSQILAMRGLK